MALQAQHVALKRTLTVENIPIQHPLTGSIITIPFANVKHHNGKKYLQWTLPHIDQIFSIQMTFANIKFTKEQLFILLQGGQLSYERNGETKIIYYDPYVQYENQNENYIGSIMFAN
jgi:hypothetical protein